MKILKSLIFLLFLLPTALVAQSENFFETETLNDGLSAAPDDLDHLTPQTAIWSFLEAIGAEDYDRAAHLLNLNDVPVPAQMQRGPELAEKLGVVLDRKVVISWQSLLERPDALNTNLPGDDPMAGQTRRSLLLGILELETRPVALRLNRVKPGDDPAVWVFSRQTVGHVDALFAEYGPSPLEKALPGWMRTKGPLDLYWWEIIGIPLTLLAAGFVAALTWRGMKWIGKKTDDNVLGGFVHDLRLPLTLTFLGLTIWLATSYVFVVSGIVSNVLEPVLVLIFVSAAMILAVNIIDAFLERITVEKVETLTSPEEEDRRAYTTTIFAVRRLVVAFAVVFGVGLTLTMANVFRTLGFSLLAGAGGLTLMIGFAAREVLGNILASLQISANRSARIGDQLIFEDKLCTVERIHFSFVQLKVWDNTRLIVPVSQFVSESFINRTLVDSDMIRNVVLTVAPHTDLDALRNYYHSWMDEDDRVGTPESYECLVTGQDEFGIAVRFCAHVPDPRDGWDVECELREALLKYLGEREAQVLPHLGTEAANTNDEAAAYDEAG